ncbi:hypothetical protein B0T17DRAFT_594042 [Bombardia bombarda]|uniref:Uncharacterized protein n=1 Tax=Bombardia bombarda TaxID=252184 RepID=A0AA39TG72_9PEZI|nr:hypothetical protein B0T17DRAFT_594042 [Bombardia bombarda]
MICFPCSTTLLDTPLGQLSWRSVLGSPVDQSCQRGGVLHACQPLPVPGAKASILLHKHDGRVARTNGGKGPSFWAKNRAPLMAVHIHIESDFYIQTPSCIIEHLGNLIWKWSPPGRNGHRPPDKVFVAVWPISISDQNVRDTLHAAFPDIEAGQLPTDEESVRRLLRERFPPFIDDPGAAPQHLQEGQEEQLQSIPEEARKHIPQELRHLVAAWNAVYLEERLQHLCTKPYHTTSGRARLTRSKNGATKIFNVWREGFARGISRREKIMIYSFFGFLFFSSIYPDIAAGFLGERSYNQRSTGARILSLFQLGYLLTYDFPILWLLYTWSLERVIGAVPGNAVYAFAALIPAVHAQYKETWFRTMMLVISICWQLSVQFWFSIQDGAEQLLTRHQMKRLRERQDAEEKIDWVHVDEAINKELVSLKAFTGQQQQQQPAVVAWEDVPLRVRVERYIKFANTFAFGRSADQLVALHKDYLEVFLDVYEDYRSASPVAEKTDKGHVEPRLPKFLLAGLDIAIFAYVCYSFWTQPFTFNTVTAYGAVCIIKQLIMAMKRYQTPKAARRLFTNMVAFNIWGIFLVSVPVTVDKDVLRSDGNMAALTLAMIFATLFLTEPIAPLFQRLSEQIGDFFSWLGQKLRSRQ